MSPKAGDHGRMTQATMVETLETYLEHARQSQTPVRLVFAGNIDAPVTAVVRARNGPTFEFVIGAAVIRMDLAGVVVRTS
jgi:hypothetical protein